jgi:acylglycerol lipase
MEGEDAAIESALFFKNGFPDTHRLTRANLGDGGSAEYLTNAQNLHIACYFWPASPCFLRDQPDGRGVVVLCHGYGGYSDYQWLHEDDPHHPGSHPSYANSWIEHLNQAGFSCVAWDYQSHGRSEGIYGQRVRFAQIDDIVDEGVRVVARARTKPRFHHGPVFVVGESLGGHVALLLAERLKSNGAVLMSPMISLEKLKAEPANWILLPFLRLLAYILPNLEVGHTRRNDYFPDVQHRWDKNPMCYKGKAKTSTSQALLTACSRLVQRLDEITLPLLVLSSGRDDYVDPDGAVALVERAASTDKQIKQKDHMYHVLTLETDWETVRDEVLCWMQERSEGY